MAKIGELISDVHLQVAAMKINAESRLNQLQTFFIIRYSHAELLTKKFSKLDSIQIYSVIDGGVFKEIRLEINPEDGSSLLPELPINFPYDASINSIYTRNGDKLNAIIPGNVWSLQSLQAGWYAPPMYIRNGRKIYFYNTQGAQSVYASIISFDIPKNDDGSINYDTEYQISADLIGPVIDMSVKRLSQSISKPEDSVADLKDNVIR